MGRAFLRGVIWLIAAASGLGLLAGFLGSVHPVGDSLSILRLPLAAALVFCAVLLRRPVWLAGAMALAAAICAVPLGVERVAAGSPGAIVIYNKNMFYRNRDIPGLLTDVRASGAEIVTLQEVSSRNLALLDGLSDLYPHQVRCRNRDWNGIAILSRYPFSSALRCTERRAAAAVEVDHPGGAFWVVSVHYSWPWPYRQDQSAALVSAMAEGLDGPVIVAGDFNIVPWAASVQDIASTVGGAVIGPRKTTLVLRGIAPLPIDHIIAGGGVVERRGRLGSDHFGILGRVTPAPR